MTNVTKVFVYGTLKRSFWNNVLLKQSKFLGLDEVVGKFSLRDLGSIPGVVRSETTGRVRGEVWEVNYYTLSALDRLEGHPDWYCRNLVRTKTGHHAWMYVLPSTYTDRSEEIPFGVWRPTNEETEVWQLNAGT